MNSRGTSSKKRRPSTSNLDGQKLCENRLSSLPDDILIGIISYLPLYLAIATGSLSRRWRGLWKNITSIHLTNHIFKYTSENVTAVDELMSQITSPSILNLGVELVPNDIGPINLPNLKILSLRFPKHDTCTMLEPLIKACPALEELSLDYGLMISIPNIRWSNQNLRRLIIKASSLKSSLIVINAPKLDYLLVNCHCSSATIIRSEEEPIVLCEANITINDVDHSLSKLEKSLATRDVMFLKLDVVTGSNKTIPVLQNITRLKLIMKMSHDIRTVLSLMDVCPVLDVLTLNLWDTGEKEWILPAPDQVSNLHRVLERIEIHTYWYAKFKPTKSLSMLVNSLLRKATSLVALHFSVAGYGDGPKVITKGEERN